MFRCDEVADRASRLIDGELGFWPRLEIRLHLAMCRGCRNFIEQMRLTRDLTARVGSLQESAPSEDIQAALTRRRLRSGTST